MELSEPPRLMLVSDLDNTMVDHKDKHHSALLRFGALWQADYNHDSVLVYSTGRSPALYAKLRAEAPLLTAGVTVMSVGTEITYGAAMAPDLGWEAELNQSWNREAVAEEAAKLNLKFQDETEQRPHKVSFYVNKDVAGDVVKLLTQRFQQRQLNAKIIYSGGIHLDVLPRGAGIGQSLVYLMKKFKSESRSPTKILVCSNSGTDVELFTLPNVCGVIVGNAMGELLKWHSEYAGDKSHVYLAKERCAAGILEAMQHFDVQPNVSPRDRPRALQTLGGVSRIKLSNVAHEVVDYLLLLEHWLKADVDNSDLVFSRLKSSLVRDGEYVHANGITTNPFSEIATLRVMHGVKKSTHYYIWVDRVRVEKLSDTLYLAKYDKWEKSGNQYTCAITTALLQSRIEAVNGLQWKLVHETWLHGREGTRTTLQASKPEAALGQELPNTQQLTPKSETGSVQESPQIDAPVQVAPTSDTVVEKAPKELKVPPNLKKQQKEAIDAEAPVQEAP